MIFRSCNSSTITLRVYCILMCRIMLMGPIYVKSANWREHGRRTNMVSGRFHGPQTRWSTIEKKAYAIYWALLRLDDLISGIPFTIRTGHRNLLFLNNHGSRKILQWKLDTALQLPLLNMSWAKPTSQPTFSVDLWPNQVMFQYSTFYH